MVYFPYTQVTSSSLIDKPTKKNKYHAEIHNGPNDDKLIDDDKCLDLSKSVILVNIFNN